MRLTIHWVNATRTEPQKSQVENAYKKELINLFETADRAYAGKEQWHRYNEPAVHVWPTFNKIAHIVATVDLLPSERNMAHFVTEFDHDN